MEVRDAVKSAKNYVAEMFEDEPIHNIGLEEIEFDRAQGVWSVTIGFAREWRESGSVMRALASPCRTYKVVRISDTDGTVQSIRHREISGAA